MEIMLVFFTVPSLIVPYDLRETCSVSVWVITVPDIDKAFPTSHLVFCSFLF